MWGKELLRHNVTFLQPLLDANQSISTFKRISLIRAVWTNGRFPISEKLVGKGETLEEAIKNARGPVVVFPEVKSHFLAHSFISMSR